MLSQPNSRHGREATHIAPRSSVNRIGVSWDRLNHHSRPRHRKSSIEHRHRVRRGLNPRNDIRVRKIELTGREVNLDSRPSLHEALRSNDLLPASTPMMTRRRIRTLGTTSQCRPEERQTCANQYSSPSPQTSHSTLEPDSARSFDLLIGLVRSRNRYTTLRETLDALNMLKSQGRASPQPIVGTRKINTEVVHVRPLKMGDN